MANVDPPGNALFVRLFVSNLHTSRRQTDENRQRTQDGGSRGTKRHRRLGLRWRVNPGSEGRQKR